MDLACCANSLALSLILSVAVCSLLKLPERDRLPELPDDWDEEALVFPYPERFFASSAASRKLLAARSPKMNT